jgi:16S rRNA (cytidine1402-2'-O)-methyltransferase
MAEIFGAKEIAVARELTKKFEEVTRAAPGAILEKVRAARPRGEFVIVI